MIQQQAQTVYKTAINATARVRSIFLLLAIPFLLGYSSTCSAVNFVNTGYSTGFQGTEIDLDSFIKSGEETRYIIRFPNWAGRVTTRIVIANCAKRQRAELSEGISPNDLQFYSVYPGTKTEKDFDIACGNVPPPNITVAPSPIVPAPINPRSITPQPPSTESVTETVKSSGSGFIVARGYVVTNDHVTGDCRHIYVSRGQKQYRGLLVASTRHSDLALIRVKELQDGHIPGVRNSALLGEDVIVAGHPLSGLLSSDLIVTSGQVNATSGLADDPTLLQISAPVQTGNSGGPLIDRSGNIVGVVVSKLNVANLAKITGDMSQNVNFAIKPEILRLFLDSAQINYRSGSLDKRVDNVRLAQSAREFTVKVECY